MPMVNTHTCKNYEQCLYDIVFIVCLWKILSSFFSGPLIQDAQKLVEPKAVLPQGGRGTPGESRKTKLHD